MFQRLKPPLGVQLNTGHPLANGLVGCWIMNERGGNIVHDLSGNGNKGAFVGTVGWNTTGLNLLGTEDNSVSITYHSLFAPGTGDFSIVCALTPLALVNGTGDQSWDNTFAISRWNTEGSGNSNSWTLNLTSDGSTEYPTFVIRLSTGEVQVADATSYVIGTHYSLCGVRDNDNIKIYRDSILRNTTGGASGAIQNGATYPIILGNNASGDYGAPIWLEYFYYYNRALTASEIASLYTNPYQMFEPDDLALWVAAADIVTIIKSIRNKGPCSRFGLSNLIGRHSRTVTGV